VVYLEETEINNPTYTMTSDGQYYDVLEKIPAKLLFANATKYWNVETVHFITSHYNQCEQFNKAFGVAGLLRFSVEEPSTPKRSFVTYCKTKIYPDLTAQDYSKLDFHKLDLTTIIDKKISSIAVIEEMNKDTFVKFAHESQPFAVKILWQLSLEELVVRYGNQGAKIGVDPTTNRTLYLTISEYAEYMNTQIDDNPLYIVDDSMSSRIRTDSGFTTPSFFPDNLYTKLPLEMTPAFHWFFLGAKRSGTMLHQEPDGTSGWLTLLHGKKLWIFIHPSVQKSSSTTSVISWLLHEFPLLKLSTNLVFCYLQLPGELVYIPAGWHHAVLNIEDSIAIGENSVDFHSWKNVKETLQNIEPDLVKLLSIELNDYP